MADQKEIRDSIYRTPNFSGLDRIYFEGNPQATRAIEQVSSLLASRFGQRGPFLERAPTWGELLRSGLVRIKTQTGKLLSVENEVNASDPIPSAFATYEEGEWLPVDGSGASLAFTGVTGSFVRIGRIVSAVFNITYPTTANGSAAIVSGLPYVSAAYHPAGIALTGVAALVRGMTDGSQIKLYKGDGSTVSNAEMTGANLRAAVTYHMV